jgi:drug/metabolite transporter (DMT)-like permease
MDINFLIGIIIGILVGICFSLGGILTRAAGKKFRNHLLQKLKQSIFFALGMIFLNIIFLVGLVFTLIGTVGKIIVPFFGILTTAIFLPVIYSTSYITTIIAGKLILKESIDKIEIIAIILLIIVIILVSQLGFI